MKTFRRILFVILCIALVVTGIGFLLPGNIHVERSAILSASPKTIFDQINILKNWVKWSPWLQTDTNTKVVYSGPESGIGASFKWISNNNDVGNGSTSIISSVSPDSIELVYDFAEKGKSTGKFFFVKENMNTNVTICFDSDLGMNPISRWVGLFSDQLIGPDLDKGLNNLNQLVKDTLRVYGYKIVDSEIPARILITVRDTTSPATVSLKLADMYKKLSLYLKTKGVSPTGNPIAIFHEYSTVKFDIEACLPVASIMDVPLGLNCLETVPQRTVMVEYLGPYKMISSAYISLQTYIKNNNLEVTDPGWEEYITFPNTKADTITHQTNIFYPVK